jgi:pimeloyl-ACP methyl ester carboxylesterase
MNVVALVKGAAVAGAALYGLIAAAAFFGQRRLLFPAPTRLAEPRAPGAELVQIVVDDRVTTYALHLPAPPGAPTLVHFHGNGEDLADQSLLIGSMRKQGLGVYAVEYPGYGLARVAALTESSIYDAAEASLRRLLELGIPRASIILQGQSLGTGVAVEMARRGYGERLVLISPYTSIVDMAALVLPFLPVRLLVRDRFDTASKASSLTLAALVIHGTNDEVIPFWMGRRIAELLPNAEFFPVQGAHHNDLFQYGSGLDAIIAAFARAGSPSTGTE